MPKVTLNKSTKIKGKGLILAGVEVEVTADQKKDLDKKGFLGEVKKSGMPSNEKEIKELVAKVKTLEAQIKDGGNTESLNEDIKLLNETLDEKDEEIKLLNEDIEALKNNTDLLGDKKK